MKLSKNFTLEEFIRSDTAKALGIDNTPPDLIVPKIQKFVTNLLQPLRDLYGKPMKINSGYRCDSLNKAVGGVPTSQHTKGEAADISCNPLDLLYILRKSGLEFDQAIVYPTFLHLSYSNNNRNQIIIKR